MIKKKRPAPDPPLKISQATLTLSNSILPRPRMPSPKSYRAPPPPPMPPNNNNIKDLHRASPVSLYSSSSPTFSSPSPASCPSPTYNTRGNNGSDSGVTSGTSSRGSLRSRVSQDSLNDDNLEFEEENSVDRTLKALTDLRDEIANNNNNSSKPGTLSKRKRAPPPPPAPNKSLKSPAPPPPPPPPPEFSDMTTFSSFEPISIASSTASTHLTFSDHAYQEEESRTSSRFSHLDMIQQGRRTLRKSASYSDQASFEQTLCDRLQTFHMNEHDKGDDNQAAGHGSENGRDQANKEDEDVDSSCFAGVRILSPIAAVLTDASGQDDGMAGEEMLVTGKSKSLAIRSKRGTVRGVKNRVRQGIATFLRDPSKKVREYSKHKTE